MLNHFEPTEIFIHIWRVSSLIKLPRNVWILSAGQALVMSIGSLTIFVGGIVGSQLAPNERLATLPVALMVVGTAISVLPTTMIMRKFGRKNSFTLILLFSVVNALWTAMSIQSASFTMLCINFLLFGLTNACVLQFRFAAMESVKPELIPNAASAVLVGGIAAAFIGPEIAVSGRFIFETEFFGSFVLLGVLFSVTIIILRFYRSVDIKVNDLERPARALSQIMKQRAFWVALSSASCGYLVMSFIMTATPVSMNIIDLHSLHSTKYVIQSHILAMFVPSIFTGFLIRKLGIKRMMLLGLMSFAVCIFIAYSGHSFVHYLFSLILLGLGWNFLFIGGTSLLPESYNSSERFKVQAVNDSVVFSSQAIASLFAGWLVFTLGWEIMLLTMVPIIVIQATIVILWKR